MPNAFIKKIFRAAAVRKGGIVRRSRVSVKRNASYRQLKAAVKKRGFHLLRSGGQYIVICNKGQCKLLA
jgi:RNase P protein component